MAFFVVINVDPAFVVLFALEQTRFETEQEHSHAAFLGILRSSSQLIEKAV
ncbi:hypothetical protein AAHB34_03450 [Paenarthrobacter ureafaciens]